MRAKLGLMMSLRDDNLLWEDLLQILHQFQIDYTNFFRKLSEFVVFNNNQSSCFDYTNSNIGDFKLNFDDFHANFDTSILTQLFISEKSQRKFHTWAVKYCCRLILENNVNNLKRKQRMNSVNPKYILRTYMAQQAIKDANNKDYREVERLLRLLKSPFSEQPDMEMYALGPLQWAQSVSLSCSS